MARLGYDRYGVQGGDVGAFIAPLIGAHGPGPGDRRPPQRPRHLPDRRSGRLAAMTEADRGRLAAMEEWQQRSGAYMQIQGTRPQTIAYALTDSPAGLLAWIVEKFQEWTDPAAELPEDAVDRDRILTDVSIYWFTGTAGSAAHTYYERFNDPAMWAPAGTLPRADRGGRLHHRRGRPSVRCQAAPTSSAGRSSPAAATSPRSRLRTCSPRTCASSSAAWSREPGVSRCRGGAWTPRPGRCWPSSTALACSAAGRC